MQARAVLNSPSGLKLLDLRPLFSPQKPERAVELL